MDRIRVGMVVVDIAEGQVGHVADVGRESFRVQIPEGDTFWLGSEALLSVCQQRVLLVCRAERMARYAVTVSSSG